jgi:hypothetical protein
VIASNLNPLGKIGNKIRHLTGEEQKYVIDNVQPEGVDISKLTESIQNFKQNKLTLDFIHGLFDGDGSISVYFTPNKSSSSESSQEVPEGTDTLLCELQNGGGETKLSVGFTFTIVQDRHNISLLNEVKSYFNDKGGIYNIRKECNIYKSGSKSDLMSVILPKMVNKESMESIKDCSLEELKLPLLKYNKIYYICKILEYCSSPGFKLNKETMNEIIRLSYLVSRESDNKTLEEYVEELNRK